MNRNHNVSKRRQQTIQLWSYDQALHAVPYITSVMGSLREHQLEAQHQQLRAHRLEKQPGRPDRDALLAHEEAVKLGRRASDQFQEALEELQALDVYCVDAIRGQALIPFARDKQLAWYIFDLFEPDPLRFWRFHNDDPETRRDIAEVLDGPAEDSAVV
jgi:hypothetical protein